jgi:hypothetical protein
VDVRSQYPNLDQDLGSYLAVLTDNPPPPAGVSPAHWDAAVAQVSAEIKAARDIRDHFANLGPLVTEIFLSDSLSVTSVAETLEMSELLDNDNESVMCETFVLITSALWAISGLSRTTPKSPSRVGCSLLRPASPPL